jgi:hypothetical protein
MATSAQAVQLVVISVNTTAIPGDKVFTIGVKIAQSDVTAPGAGTNPPLFVQGITFNGDGTNPIQQAGAANKVDIQSVQTSFVDNSATTNVGPPTNATLGTSGVNALYKDSWWYQGSGGVLTGVIDSAGDSGTVTTTPATDGSGVYTLGPTANVGTTGFLFQSEGTGIVPSSGPTTGNTMSFSGLFGPLGNNALDGPPLAGQFVGGFLTVPLAQIATAGNVTLLDKYTGGTGTFLSVGQVAYDLSGKAAGTDTPAILNFATGTIQFAAIPEPGTFLLTGLGALGLLLAWRRRK